MLLPSIPHIIGTLHSTSCIPSSVLDCFPCSMRRGSKVWCWLNVVELEALAGLLCGSLQISLPNTSHCCPWAFALVLHRGSQGFWSLKVSKNSMMHPRMVNGCRKYAESKGRMQHMLDRHATT
eukprot:464525-Pelagomonas_calceolata.AAC.2